MSRKRKKKASKRAEAKRGPGRPKGPLDKITISFRIPITAKEAFEEMADEETSHSMGREIRVSEVYNRALGEFALENGIEVPGWNVPL